MLNSLICNSPDYCVLDSLILSGLDAVFVLVSKVSQSFMPDVDDNEPSRVGLFVNWHRIFAGVAECRYELPSSRSEARASPTLLPGEKGAVILVPSPWGGG